MKGIKTRIFAAILAAAMILTSLPIHAEPAEPEYLPEIEIDESYAEEGKFYLASAGADIPENAGHGYLLKVARWGEGDKEASVRLTMTDMTAEYGRDYTVFLYDSSLFEGIVHNAKKSESMAGYLANHDKTEYNYSDAVVDGVISSDDSASEGEISEEQKNAVKEAVESLNESGKSTEEASGQTSELTKDREAATGLDDDREPMKYSVPEDDSILYSDSMMYMSESIAGISEELNSAYMIIGFGKGETEKYVLIMPKDNDESDGKLRSGFALSGEDGAEVSGMYSDFTLNIVDDEPYVPDVISFTQSEFYPEDGYVSVTVRRSGNLSEVITAMLDTEDVTAIGGRDYSQVHAKLIFGFGIDERTVKIPVRSDYVDEESEFKVLLTLPQECAIGNGTAAVKIAPDAKGYVTLEEKAVLREFAAASLGATQDMNLDSIVLGEKFCLPDMHYNSYTTNKDCKSEPFGEDGWLLYAHKHGDDVEASVGFSVPGGTHYDYSGYQIIWERKSDKPCDGWTKFQSWYSGMNLENLYYKDTARWGKDTDIYYIKHSASWMLGLCLFAETGFLAKNPTLQVTSITPVLRPFKIQLYGADPFKLIDNNGKTVNNTETTSYSNENEVLMLNSDSSNSVVTTTGEYINIELRNSVKPISYISELYIVNIDSGEKKLIGSYDPGTSKVALEITNDLIGKNLDYVLFKNNGSHGLYGTFAIKPVVSAMPAKVYVQKDDRIDVTLWNESIIKPVSSNEKEDVYECSVGDILRYNVKVRDDVSAYYDWSRVKIETILPKRQSIDIYRETGLDYAQTAVGGSETRISVIVAEKTNLVKVRVRPEDISLFDTSTGIFTCPKGENEGYYDFIIDGSKVAGKKYELTANVIDESYVPEWSVGFASGVRYSQRTFYFTGDTEADKNVIYLSAKKADETRYCIKGTVYYDDVALGGVTSPTAWYPAFGAYYIIDSANYGIADTDGNLRTTRFKGICGDYVRVKVTVAGHDEFFDVVLSNKNKVTESYSDDVTVEMYEIETSNRIVSANNYERPHIKSITATQGTSALAVSSIKINDISAVLTAVIELIDPATGKNYTYKYTDENGVEQEREETPTGLEFVIIDPVTHKEKYVIPAKSSSDGTWKATYVFKTSESSKYKPGDIIYARLTTDRFVGDGCGEDETGARVPVEALRKTTYVPVRSFISLSGINPQVTDPININFDSSGYMNLPIIGTLTLMINAVGMSFGISETETGGVRLFVGKQISSLTTGNFFDENGKPYSDTGHDYGVTEMKKAFRDMEEKLKYQGNENKLGAMSMGIPAWSIEPMAGIYFEFAVYQDASGEETETRMEFAGGGGYIGVIGTFRYTYYMLVYGVPVYVGGDVSITLMTEFGIAADEEAHIGFKTPDQENVDYLIEHSHFQFIFMSIVSANAYAGWGICGTVGLRGGFNLYLRFMVNPMVQKTYPSVRKTGVAVTGTIKFWADIVLLSIPIPLYSWDLLSIGYFEDIAKLKEDNETLLEVASGRKESTISKKSRNDISSAFMGDVIPLRGTFDEISSRVIVKNSYDDAQQKLIPVGDGRILMVYLDDDLSRTDDERTVLKYSVLERGVWSEPAVIQNDGTADFSPSLCDAGDSILVTWVSRPEGTEITDYSEHLSKNEIYAVMIDKDTLVPGKIERLTDDACYDTAPTAVYDSNTGDILVFYSKSEVGTIENAEDLMKAALPYVNGNVLMYMINHDGEWLFEEYLPGELANPEEGERLIEKYNGQRFLPLNAFGKTNPVISDLTAIAGTVTNLNNQDLKDFDVRYLRDNYGIVTEGDDESLESFLDKIENGEIEISEEEYEDYIDALDEFKAKWTGKYGIMAYTIDEDNDLGTENDREVFVQLYDFTTHKTDPAIRITNNSENDSMPQLVSAEGEVYLFWLHDGKEIRYIKAVDMMADTDDEGFVRYCTVRVKEAEDEIDRLSISNFKPFVDNEGNLFVAWQQNSAKLSDGETDYGFAEDIYLAGYVNEAGETRSSWSDAIRMTDNGKVNELPEFADLGDGKLMMVNTQYDFDVSGDSYVTENVELVETDYITVSSLKVVDVITEKVPQNDGDSFEVKIVIKNTGVKPANGFSYQTALLSGGKVIQEIPKEECADVIPAGGLYTLSQVFSPAAGTEMDIANLNVNMIITENGVSKNLLSGAYLFDGLPQYEFANLKAVQEGNTFRISGIARNVGSAASDGTDTVKVRANYADSENVYAAVIPAAETGVEVPFSIVVPIDAKKTVYGSESFVLSAESSDGRRRSDDAVITAMIVNAFNLVLNGDGDTEVITLKKGETLALSVTYEPASFLRNANAKYAVDDPTVASVKDSVLYADAEGETVLRMTVDPFGGSKTVKVIVEGEIPDTGDDAFTSLSVIMMLVCAAALTLLRRHRKETN